MTIATITVDDSGLVEEHVGCSWALLTDTVDEFSFVAGVELDADSEGDVQYVSSVRFGDDKVCDMLEETDVFVSCYSMIQDNLTQG